MAANIDNKVLELLEKYNQGLSIDNIAKVLEISRTTAARHLDVLVTAGKLKRRDVGNTKLHYLPKHFKEIKFSIIFLLSGFFVFNFFTTDGIAIPNFNYIFQEVFIQALQVMLLVGILSFVGIFSVYKVINVNFPKLNFWRTLK